MVLSIFDGLGKICEYHEISQKKESLLEEEIGFLLKEK